MELDELVHELIPISPSVELKEDEGPKLITIPPSVELKEDERPKLITIPPSVELKEDEGRMGPYAQN